MCYSNEQTFLAGWLVGQGGSEADWTGCFFHYSSLVLAVGQRRQETYRCVYPIPQFSQAISSGHALGVTWPVLGVGDNPHLLPGIKCCIVCAIEQIKQAGFMPSQALPVLEQ